MMKKRINALLCAVLSLSLAGCGANGNAVEQGAAANIAEQTESTETQVLAQEETAEAISFSEEELPVCAMGESNFANSVLVTDMTYEMNGKNVMFSPLSLNFALGLVLEGTDEDSPSRTVIEKYLNSKDYSIFVKNYLKYAKKMNAMEVPENSSMENHFDIANGIWINQEYQLLDSYRTAVRDSYEAEIEALDFKDAEKVASTVNNWVNQKTRSMIPQIIGPDLIAEDAAAVLTNAIYFEAPWIGEWKPSTGDEEFRNMDGSSCKPEFIQSACSDYFENDKATAFGKKYANGLEFIGILPKETGNFSLADLEIEELLQTRTTAKTTATMPELDFSTNIKLDTMLQSLGMGILYSNDADITKMCTKELKVASILQKTKLELNAEGTKASAATAVVMFKATAAVSQELTHLVVLDRPFAFVIYDPENQVPVFMGKVTDLRD